MKQKNERDPYRKAGMITFEHTPISILIDKKTGMMKFQKHGKDITDNEEIDRIFAYLKEVNKEQ